VIFIDLSFYHGGKEKKRTELVFVATNQVIVTRELNSVEFFLFLLQFSRKKRKKRIIFKKEAKKRSFHRKGGQRGKRGGVGCQLTDDFAKSSELFRRLYSLNTSIRASQRRTARLFQNDFCYTCTISQMIYLSFQLQS
jgi:hypothetical protein